MSASRAEGHARLGETDIEGHLSGHLEGDKPVMVANSLFAALSASPTWVSCRQTMRRRRTTSAALEAATGREKIFADEPIPLDLLETLSI